MQDIVLVTLSSTAVETAIAQCTSRWAMARGHRLNTSIVLAAVHGLSGLFRAVSAVEPFTLSSPSHSVPVPNRPSCLRGRGQRFTCEFCHRVTDSYIRASQTRRSYRDEPKKKFFSILHFGEPKLNEPPGNQKKKFYFVASGKARKAVF